MLQNYRGYVALSLNPVTPRNIKYIGIPYHFVQELYNVKRQLAC